MNPGLLIGLSLAFGAVVFWYTWQKQKMVHVIIQRTAEALGLQYRAQSTVGPAVLAVFAPWRMEGVYQGTRVECYSIVRGGRNRTTYTVVEAFPAASLSLGLHLGRETALTRLGKMVLDLQDVAVGNQRFDEAVRVKAANVEGAKVLLARPGLQEAILRALEYSPTTVVTDHSVRMERLGNVTNMAVLAEALERVTAVAKALGS